MLWLRSGCFFCVLCFVVTAPTNKDVSSLNSMYDTVTSYGYVAENHQVITEDGYILGVYRIPYPRYQSSGSDNRPVVFCMHGLYGQSTNFIMLEPELAIGFNLADAGFDVWFGNARGNIHSRAHITLDPDENSAQFFDFSWEEIGMYDLAAMIDYVLNQTNRDKLHYIGHSQGGTTFLVLTSMRPEYNDKMASVHLLAGVGYQEHFPDETIKSLAQNTDIIYTFANIIGVHEFTDEAFNEILDGFGGEDDEIDPIIRGSNLCFGGIKKKHTCELVENRHLIRDTDNDTLSESGGGSVKQIAHYGQNIRDLMFRRFDYGFIRNLLTYGSTRPPNYDLGLITSNVVMHYSLNDHLLDERDVLAMVADMPNTVARKVARDSFEHSDYVIADDAKELVTDFIIESINNEHYGREDDAIDAPSIGVEDETYIPVEEPVPAALTDDASLTSLNLIFKLYLLICTVYFISVCL